MLDFIPAANEHGIVLAESEIQCVEKLKVQDVLYYERWNGWIEVVIETIRWHTASNSFLVNELDNPRYIRVQTLSQYLFPHNLRQR